MFNKIAGIIVILAVSCFLLKVLFVYFAARIIKGRKISLLNAIKDTIGL